MEIGRTPWRSKSHTILTPLSALASLTLRTSRSCCVFTELGVSCET